MGVLDDMTKGITERKSAKAGANLTPVGVEGSPTKPSLSLPEVPEVFLTKEAVADIARDLRTQAATLVAVADGLDRYTGSTVPQDPDKQAAVEQKLAEKEADRRDADRKAAKKGDKKAAKRVEDAESFDARMKRLSDEAKAATFTASDDAPKGQEAPATPADGWVCPEHGAEDIEELTSRLRPAGYLACAVAGCGEFEPKG